MKAPKTLSRADLQKLLVTDADAFTALRFLRQRERMPALAELEAAGEQKLPGTAGALADIYHVLWAATPVVRDDAPSDRSFFAEILKGAMATSAYEGLHAQTRFSELASILGTLTMGDTIVANVSKGDAKKLQESADAQNTADETEAEAQKAEAEADMLGELAEQAQSAGGAGQPSSQAAGLSAQAAEARAQAQAARAAADTAQAQADAAAESLMGKPGSEAAAKKLQELARLGLAAAKRAKEKVEEVSETLQTWGFEEGELTREGIPEALALLERIQNNKAFKDFAKILGRIKKIAARKARSKEQAEGVRVTKFETGRDIKRAVSSELVALAHPALRTKALTRWSRGELRLRGEEAKQKMGEGPVVVCEDGSGSMEGAKQVWAKATVLALAYYAKLRKRSFVWIHYGARDSKNVTRVYKGGRLSPRETLEIAETFLKASGTDFERPLTDAMNTIRIEGLKKADIAFITDGDAHVTEAFLAEFLAEKRLRGVNVVGILCDVGHTSDATLKRFCDGDILRASSFSDADAQEVFNRL